MAGLCLAIVVYMLSTKIVGRETKAEVAEGLGKIAAWVSVIYLIIKLGDLAVAGKLPALFALDDFSLLMLAELGLGALVPAVMLLNKSLREKPFVRWAAPTMVLLGVLANRFNITLFAQRVPGGAVYVPTMLEWLSTIGIIAGVALVWYIAVQYLVLFDSKAELKYHH
jgi:Ni/Fe-hydrogenase subunit HybB-like protein